MKSTVPVQIAVVMFSYRVIAMTFIGTSTAVQYHSIVAQLNILSHTAQITLIIAYLSQLMETFEQKQK